MAQRLWLPLLIAFACFAAGRLTPLMSPLLLGLIAGVGVANSRLAGLTVFQGLGPVTKTLLRLGIVLIGFRLSLPMLVELGIEGLVIITVSVSCTFMSAVLIGRRLGIGQGLVLLIASGFAICGAAAIAAVESVIRRKDEDVAIALAMVTLYGTGMIVAVPMLGAVLGMSDVQIGIWAGASIHEVAQVVAAASITGGGAVAIATTVKLGRVVMLGAANWASARLDRRGQSDDVRPKVGILTIPWFVVGFLAAIGVRSLGLFSPDIIAVLDGASSILLAAGMFGLGLGVRFRALFPLPWRVVGLSTAVTGIAAVVPLGLVLLLVA